MSHNTKKFFFCFLIMASVALTALLSGAETRVIPRVYRESAWSEEDGLPDNSVTACLQTRDGFIWMGTEKGLARFDGVSFRVFDTWNTRQLHSDRIERLLHDVEYLLLGQPRFIADPHHQIAFCNRRHIKKLPE